MSLRTLLGPVLGILLFGACLPARYTFDKLPDQQLRFGSGGGFSGALQEYVLLRNGQIFLFETGPGKRDTFELQSLSKADTRILFGELDTLRLQKYDFNYPGNMSYFIRLTDEQTDQTVQWGDPRWAVRKEVSQFHSELTAIMDNRKVVFDVKKDREKEKPKEPTFW